MSGTSHAWRVAGASVLGDFHAREGRINQDAVGWVPNDGAGGRIVAAVSDGHGASVHFRSDRGARFAVEQALDILAWHMDDDDPGVEALPAATVAGWRDAVLADMAADPLDRSGTRPGATLAPYGATLLAVAANDAEMTLLQIGDGDMLLLYADGRVVRPMVADADLVGEQTYSLCMDDAETRVKIASLWRTSDWPMAVLLATDGVSKSFRDEAAFQDAARQLAQHARDDWAAFAAELPDWLSAISHHGSGDDASLCLALNLGAGAR